MDAQLRLRLHAPLRAALLALGWGALACGGPGPVPADATFDSGDVRLSYALDLPPGRGPFPAFVFGHGSGAVTKDAAAPLAARLAASGFAVLRYDKRGVGGSTGVYEGVGVANGERVIGLLADDMAAGVDFLRRRPGIDPDRIGLIGGSQAGWVIPLAARRSGQVRFLVVLVGPTVSVGEEIFYSQLAEGTTTSFDELSRQLAGFQGPRGYDPLPDLAALHVPGLWVLGGQDRSLPTRESVALLERLAQLGKPYVIALHPEMTHNLVVAGTGQAVDPLPEILAFLGPYR